MIQIETFEVPEIAGCDGTQEDDAEAKALIEKLGLTGQKNLLQKDGSRFPYRPMTADEHKIYSVLLPQAKTIDEYDEAPIPLRVLQVAAHAKSCLIEGKTAFHKIEVWSATSAEVKDPILVGRHGSEYSYTRYLLARWGEELQPLNILRGIAKQMRFAELKDIYGKIAASAQAALATVSEATALETKVPQYLSDLI